MDTQPAVDLRQVVERIDSIMRELEILRRELIPKPAYASPLELVDKLHGALGHGTWDEYDMDLDWARFSQ